MLSKLFHHAERLKKEAANSSKRAYAPYSHFHVGAAVLWNDNAVTSGCNVENRSYGLTSCAERNAVFQGIREGRQKIKAIYVFCADADYAVPPCGACRQVISEFAEENCEVYFSGKDSAYKTMTLNQLYPEDSLHELKD